MKTIATLTFQNALNYGAVCQAYSLQTAIKRMGYETKIVNYHNPFLDKLYYTPAWKKFITPKGIYSIIFNAPVFRRKKEFQHFLDTYCDLTEDVYADTFDDVINRFDKVFVGSDQVWNLGCSGNDLHYFLPNQDNKMKYSYAASTGKKVCDASCQEVYLDYLPNFISISVRELSSKKMLEQIIDKDIFVDLDPVFLQDKEEWLHIAEKPVDKRYCLMYLLYEDKNLIKAAKKYANENGVRLLYINDGLFKIQGITNLRHVSPEQWLGYIAYSECVFTNSFHGIALSLLLGKNLFPRLLPGNREVNARMEDLFTTMGLKNDWFNEHRILETKKILDYKLLETERNKSINHLKTMLEQ